MKDYSRYLGAKFYTYEGKDLRIVRMISFVNTETARVIDLKTNETFKVPYESLEKDYNLLNPDGYTFFHIVTLPDNLKDVVVSLFRNIEMENNDTNGYCVCRQNINDVYHDIIDSNAPIVGCCMSKETIPDGVDFKIMRACNSIEFICSVCVYMTDKLDDILQCIKKINMYDIVLEENFQRHIESLDEYTIYKDNPKDKPIYNGYCRTLKSLLEDNSFMYDFRRGFFISEIKSLCVEDHIIKGNTTSGAVLDEDAVIMLEKEYNFYITDTLVMKYDKDIDLSKITRDKILISDKNEETYLILYTKGQMGYIEKENSLADLDPMQKLQNIFESTNS